MLTGRNLQGRCSDEKQPAPVNETDAWAAEVEKYLADNWGESYVARFRSHAGLPMSATSIESREHRNVWSFLHTRLARLEQFIQEVART